METIDFECNECGHTADFSKEQVMDHIKSHFTVEQEYGWSGEE